MELYDILKGNFEFSKVVDVPIDTYIGGTPEWTSIGSLTRDVKAEEIWMVGMSIAWTFDTTNKSAILRYTVDGGTTWYMSEEEPKDKTDTRHATYAFPITYTEDTTLDFRVEVTKEDSGHTLMVEFCDLTLERKG